VPGDEQDGVGDGGKTVYTAADEESRERLRWLVEHTEAASLDPAHQHTH
jgi:hypothetical protein